MAGYWEFPGGKFEPGESASEALYRELEEELGVVVENSEPLIELVHHYPERSVRLHVRIVRQWLGEPKSLDQQALAWAPASRLTDWDLLPADAPIVKALLLPDNYVVSPSLPEALAWPDLEAQLTAIAQHGVRLLQWRQPSFVGPGDPSHQTQEQATRVASWARNNAVVALLNVGSDAKSIEWAMRLGFDGIHFSESALRDALARGLSKEDLEAQGLQWLAASCHGLESLSLAKDFGCDFAVLGTVLPTLSHPQAELLGWSGFAERATAAGLPVYAIGGCGADDVATAKAAGGQGVAGISAFWPSEWLETKAG
jgi:8-oxo-dGTP diphosphatase